jgi:hypothetical protein
MRSRDLVESAPQVVFRHPLVGSDVYQSTPLSHNAGFIGRWRLRMTRASIRIGPRGILGMAARGPDDAVASIMPLPPSSWLSRTRRTALSGSVPDGCPAARHG